MSDRQYIDDLCHRYKELINQYELHLELLHSRINALEGQNKRLTEYITKSSD